MEWLNVINNLLSEYKVSPPPPNQQLEVKDIQNIIIGILASPIRTTNENKATNDMLNEIDLEFSKKLDKMVLSDPESELGGRRADEQQNMMVTTFLRDNRERQKPLHLRNKGLGLLTHTRTTFGGRQYKRRRKSSATKHRRRRTSRK